MKPNFVSMKEMLNAAKHGNYAIGHFNTNNLEWTKAILTASQKDSSPLIISASEGAVKYMGGFNTVSALISNMMQDLQITVPVALHLDHGSYEGGIKALDAGFSSIMFDGSHLPFEENMKLTSTLLKLTRDKGASLEAEVGAIGGEEDGIQSNGEIASPDECRQITDLGITALAAGIGNIHGIYPANWKGLDFDALAAIKAAADIPLVLHGGTGIPEDQIKKAISLGITKVNVNTEFQVVFAKATRKYIEDGKDLEGKGFDPRKLLKPGYEAIMDEVHAKIALFGSANKA
jgi:fructose-bisphosphate aldolase class II